MLFFYGTGEKKMNPNQERAYTCPNCRERRLYFHLFRSYFHIFWIPFIAIGKREVAACEACDSVYQGAQIPNDLSLDLSTEKSLSKKPYTLFAGLIIAVLAVVGFAVFNDGKTTYEYPNGQKEARGKLVDDKQEGEWEFWHENGQKAAVQYYLNGLEDSVWTWWDEDGNVTEVAHYKHGMLQGLKTRYFPNGNKFEEAVFVEGRLHGKAQSWYESGSLNSEGAFERNQREGKWKHWYENGQLLTQGSYIEGSETGLWESYYEDGTRQAVLNYEGVTRYVLSFWTRDGKQLVANGNGHYQNYHENGQLESEGAVLNGLPQGDWTRWYANGNKMENGTYVNDLFVVNNSWKPDGSQMVWNGSGEYTLYHNNGAIESFGWMENGLREGLWTYNAEDGTTMSTIIYKEGNMNGKMVGYYEGGQKRTEGMYENNIASGQWTWYHTNGEKESSVNVINDKKEGEQLTWSANGALVKKEVYENGELISEEVY